MTTLLLVMLFVWAGLFVYALKDARSFKSAKTALYLAFAPNGAFWGLPLEGLAFATAGLLALSIG